MVKQEPVAFKRQRKQRRPPRTSPQTRPRNHRPVPWPVFPEESPGQLWVSAVLNVAREWGSYLVHAGKKHQSNLGRRRAREAASAGASASGLSTGYGNASTTYCLVNHLSVDPKLVAQGIKLKIRDPTTRYTGIRVQVHYPNPRSPQLPAPLTRLMSAFEQRIEPPNKSVQYLLIAGPPYQIVALKVPAKEIHESWSFWDEATRLLHMKFYLNNNKVKEIL